MQPIDFSFKIKTVGLSDIGQFKDVVTEIRYFFVGHNSEKHSERFYVRSIPTDNLDPNTFVPANQLSEETLIEWVEAGLDEREIGIMKQSMTDELYPPIKYVSMDFFNS